MSTDLRELPTWREAAGRFLLTKGYVMQSPAVTIGEVQTLLEEFGGMMLEYFEAETERLRKQGAAPRDLQSIERGARELFRLGNERIGERKWEDVAKHYLDESEACLRAAAQSDWIQVEKLLPPKLTTVMVAWLAPEGGKWTNTGYYGNEGVWYEHEIDGSIQRTATRATHWMAMPRYPETTPMETVTKYVCGSCNGQGCGRCFYGKVYVGKDAVSGKS